MGWLKDKVQKAKDVGSSLAGKAQDSELSGEVMDQIRRASKDAFKKAGHEAGKLAANEKTFNLAVDMAYQAVPFPVRLAVGKDRFRKIMYQFRESLPKEQQSG